MKGLRLGCALMMLVAAGCSEQEKEKTVVVPASSSKPRAKVQVGDSYVDVLDKLGKPNINSVTENSRVLIYDRIEVKIQNDLVVEVHDHR